MTIEGIARHNFEAKHIAAVMLMCSEFCARIRAFTQLNKS